MQAKADLRQAEYQLSSARMGGPNMYKAMSEDELLDLGRRKDRLKVGVRVCVCACVLVCARTPRVDSFVIRHELCPLYLTHSFVL